MTASKTILYFLQGELVPQSCFPRQGVSLLDRCRGMKSRIALNVIGKRKILKECDLNDGISAMSAVRPPSSPYVLRYNAGIE